MQAVTKLIAVLACGFLLQSCAAFVRGTATSFYVPEYRPAGTIAVIAADEAVDQSLEFQHYKTFGQLTYGPSVKLMRISFGHPKERQFIVSYKQFATFSDKLVEKLGAPSLDSLMNDITITVDTLLFTQLTQRGNRSKSPGSVADPRNRKLTWIRN